MQFPVILQLMSKLLRKSELRYMIDSWTTFLLIFRKISRDTWSLLLISRSWWKPTFPVTENDNIVKAREANVPLSLFQAFILFCNLKNSLKNLLHAINPLSVQLIAFSKTRRRAKIFFFSHRFLTSPSDFAIAIAWVVLILFEIK